MLRTTKTPVENLAASIQLQHRLKYQVKGQENLLKAKYSQGGGVHKVIETVASGL